MFKKQRKLLIGLMLIAAIVSGGEASAAIIDQNFTNPIAVQSVIQPVPELDLALQIQEQQIYQRVL